MLMPWSFRCALSRSVMLNPVATRDGFVFERVAIAAWFSKGNRTNPVTGKPLESLDLRPEIPLRKAIVEYLVMMQAGPRRNRESAERAEALANALAEAQRRSAQDSELLRLAEERCRALELRAREECACAEAASAEAARAAAGAAWEARAAAELAEAQAEQKCEELQRICDVTVQAAMDQARVAQEELAHAAAREARRVEAPREEALEARVEAKELQEALDRLQGAIAASAVAIDGPEASPPSRRRKKAASAAEGREETSPASAAHASSPLPRRGRPGWEEVLEEAWETCARERARAERAETGLAKAEAIVARTQALAEHAENSIHSAELFATRERARAQRMEAALEALELTVVRDRMGAGGEAGLRKSYVVDTQATIDTRITTEDTLLSDCSGETKSMSSTVASVSPLRCGDLLGIDAFEGLQEALELARLHSEMTERIGQAEDTAELEAILERGRDRRVHNAQKLGEASSLLCQARLQRAGTLLASLDEGC